MNVREIITNWLKSNNYDGLAGDECGCLVDDLAPCMNGNGGDCLECEPGYRVDDPTGKYEWIVTTEKEATARTVRIGNLIGYHCALCCKKIRKTKNNRIAKHKYPLCSGIGNLPIDYCPNSGKEWVE